MIDSQALTYAWWLYFASMMVVLVMVIRRHGYLEELTRWYFNDNPRFGFELSDRMIYWLTAFVELLVVFAAPWVVWSSVAVRVSRWRGRRARLREMRTYTTTFDTDEAAAVDLVLTIDESDVRGYFGGRLDATEPVSVRVSSDDVFDSIEIMRIS